MLTLLLPLPLGAYSVAAAILFCPAFVWLFVNGILDKLWTDYHDISEIGRLWIREQSIKFTNIRIRIRALGLELEQQVL